MKESVQVVVTSRNGIMATERLYTDSPTNRVRPVSRKFKIQEDVPFYIRVTTFLKTPVTIPEIMFKALGTELQYMITAYDKHVLSSKQK